MEHRLLVLFTRKHKLTAWFFCLYEILAFVCAHINIYTRPIAAARSSKDEFLFYRVEKLCARVTNARHNSYTCIIPLAARHMYNVLYTHGLNNWQSLNATLYNACPAPATPPVRSFLFLFSCKKRTISSFYFHFLRLLFVVLYVKIKLVYDRTTNVCVWCTMASASLSLALASCHRQLAAWFFPSASASSTNTKSLASNKVR